MSQALDIFLSFKNLDEHNRSTRDAGLAKELYDFLTARGLNVFLSTISLERQGVSSDKKAIDHALDTAQVSIAIGTSGRIWSPSGLRYEWDSFFNDILSGVPRRFRGLTSDLTRGAGT